MARPAAPGKRAGSRKRGVSRNKDDVVVRPWLKNGPPPDEPMLTSREVANVLRESTETLRRWRDKNWPPPHYRLPSGKYLYAESDIVALLQRIAYAKHTDLEREAIDAAIAKQLAPVLDEIRSNALTGKTLAAFVHAESKRPTWPWWMKLRKRA